MSSVDIATDRHGDPVGLPIDVVTQTVGILAKKGKGKTYAFLKLAEQLHIAGQQVVIADVVGVCWGIRASADGEGPGMPFLVLGGDHADAPLHADQGELVADVVIGAAQSFVLDLSDMTGGEMTRFMAAFCNRLYHKNRQPLHLILDEADAFAPQRALPGEQVMLGAVDKLVRRGRAKGIGVTLVTQRPAVLNKNVLSMVELLILMGVSSPQDLKAIESIVSVHDENGRAGEVIASLPSLAAGEAWFWSPSWLGVLKRVNIGKRITFDSSRTPSVGERRLDVPADKLASVDIEALREQMTVAVDEHQRNDPKRLRARIEELERELRSAKPDRESEIDDLRVRVLRAEAQTLDLFEAVERIAAIIEPFSAIDATFTYTEPANESATTEQAPATESGEERSYERPIPKPQQRMLDALASFHSLGISAVSKANLAVYSDQSSKSSGFRANLSALKAKGLIANVGAHVQLTHEGKALSDAPSRPVSREHLLGAWCSKLSQPQARMLRKLASLYPDGIHRSALASATSQSPTSSGYRANLSKLKGLELVTYSGQEVVCTSLLFPEGLR